MLPLFFVFTILVACNNGGNNTPKKSDTSSINSDTAKQTSEGVTVHEPDYWHNDSIVPASTRKLLDSLVTVSGLTRTYIENTPGARLPGILANVQPNATYRTTLVHLDLGQETNVPVEIHRFGRLLLGFRLGKDKLPAINPGWIGYDSAGKFATQVDAFYLSIPQSDSNTFAIGKQILSVFPNDFEFGTYVALSAKKLGYKDIADTLKSSLMKEFFTQNAEMKNLLIISVMNKDFNMISAMGHVIAHRKSIGRLILKL